MTYVCSQVPEKGREQKQAVSTAFVDLRKALDTVDRGVMFSVLRQFECRPVFLGVLTALYTRNTAAVRVGTEQFEDTMGVKQGCVLALVLFNVFLLAVTLLSVRKSAVQERPAGVVMRHYRGMKFVTLIFVFLL